MGLAYKALLDIPEGTEAADIQTSADNMVTDILALTDIEQTKDLAAGAYAFQQAALVPYAPPATVFQSAAQAIQKHVANLNSYLTTNSVKVSKDFADLWRALFGPSAITDTNVFYETVVIARSVVITGATTDTETPGSDLPAGVGPVRYEVEVIVDIGSATAVTLTMKKYGGAVETKVVNLTTGEDAGDKVDIGLSTDLYIGCTASAHTGGTTGEFKVQNKVTRIPVL